MSNPQADRTFRLTVEERFNVFRTNVETTLLRFVQADVARRAEQVVALRDSADQLMAVLNTQSRPGWLQSIRQAANAYTSSRSDQNGKDLLTTIAHHYIVLNSNYDFFQAPPGQHNFDAIFDRVRQELNIEELFDKCIEAIQEIIKTEQVEIVTILRGLEECIDILKENRGGSYVAIRQSSFAVVYVKNAVILGLKKIPGLDVLIGAYEKSVEELDAGVNEVERKLIAESEKVISDSLPRLEQLPKVIEAFDPKGLPAPAEVDSDAKDEES